jgi:hypothetical protein
VLTGTDELQGADEFVYVAISTKLTDPLPANWIPLPWAADGHAKSGLTEPSVAKCMWLGKASRDEIVRSRGWLPSKVVVEIMRAVNKT